MNGIILELAALLLSLFCLIYSCTLRRELYVPLPRGLRDLCGNRHSVFLALLGTLLASSAVSVAGGVAALARHSARTLLYLRCGYHLFHNVGPLLLILYVRNLCAAPGEDRKRCSPLLVLPLALSELLVLTNPLTRLCWRVENGVLVSSPAGSWAIFAAAALYLTAGLVLLLRSGEHLSGSGQRAGVLLLVTAGLGMTVQAVWSVPVELFFEAVTLFGLMSLLEQEEDEGALAPASTSAAALSSLWPVSFCWSSSSMWP